MNQDEPSEQSPEATIRELIAALVSRQRAVWKAGRPGLKAAIRTLDMERERALANDLWARYGENDNNVSFLYFMGLLNATNPGALADLWSTLIARDQFWPGWLYLGAPPAISERLLRLMDSQRGGQGRNRLLQALAWIGDERVVAQFQAGARTRRPGGMNCISRHTSTPLRLAGS